VVWLASVVLAVPAAAQSADSALARAERAYQGLRSLTAEFEQVITNPMLGDPERSRGTVYLEAPSRFAMRFAEPAGDRIVADGTWLWLYAPSTVPGQVIRRPIPRSGVVTPDLFQQFVRRPEERYVVRYLGADSVAGEAVDVVHLVPRQGGLGFAEAGVGIARRDGLIRRIALVEESGQRRLLTFFRLTSDAPIPRQEVTFEVPPGVRVVN
jgi:outer membrane lipoprotein carrier protein